MSEEELKEMEENKEATMMEIKANNWFKMIYYLTSGDITRTENVMTTNANYIFHTLGFEKMNTKWISQFK
jgi:acyl-CoA synthetase (AMP-forming)/AMP-acid ligase II